MALDPAPIRIATRYQGPSGQGQGGWTAAQFAEALPDPVTIALRAAVPLDADLHVIDHDGSWRLTAGDGTTVMIAESWRGVLPDTTPVSVDEARAARLRFAHEVTEHPAPNCFSCGAGADAMGVQASPLPDGRFATDWTVPAWAARPDGSVEPGVVWAAVDCTAAWWVTMSDQPRTALTAQLTVEVLEPLEVGATYALVGWGGAGPGGWDGRKRHAASAAFDRDGRCVARSSSFWLSVDTP